MEVADKPPLSAVCELCNKSFGSKIALQRHGMIHSGHRPYACSHCRATFRCSSHLKRHQRLHTGERPYACSTCSKRYADSTSLLRHCEAAHDQLPYPCGHCDRRLAFSLERELRLHLEKAHSIFLLPANGRARAMCENLRKRRKPQATAEASESDGSGNESESDPGGDDSGQGRTEPGSSAMAELEDPAPRRGRAAKRASGECSQSDSEAAAANPGTNSAEPPTSGTPSARGNKISPSAASKGVAPSHPTKPAERTANTAPLSHSAADYMASVTQPSVGMGRGLAPGSLAMAGAAHGAMGPMASPYMMHPAVAGLMQQHAMFMPQMAGMVSNLQGHGSTADLASGSAAASVAPPTWPMMQSPQNAMWPMMPTQQGGAQSAAPAMMFMPNMFGMMMPPGLGTPMAGPAGSGDAASHAVASTAESPCMPSWPAWPGMPGMPAAAMAAGMAAGMPAPGAAPVLSPAQYGGGAAQQFGAPTGWPVTPQAAMLQYQQLFAAQAALAASMRGQPGSLVQSMMPVQAPSSVGAKKQ